MPREQKNTKADDALELTLKAAKSTVLKAAPKIADTTPAPALKKTAVKPSPEKSVAKRAGGEIKINRKRKRVKTGATIPFSQTVTPDTANRYYALNERIGGTMGATLDRASLALERELNKDKH